MKKNRILLFLLFSVAILGFSEGYNINNLFSINLPGAMEVVSINQYLRVKSDATQYSIISNIYFIYENRYFSISIQCYGNTNRSILNGIETYNMRRGTYYANYNIASQINYLKQNYRTSPLKNSNGLQYAKLVSLWPSGMSSDYYGLYFLLPNSEFNECILSIYNAWDALAVDQKLVWNDNNYKTKYISDGGKLREFFELLETLEESIDFKNSDGYTSITNGYAYEKYTTDYSYIFPAISNLRMRSSPSLTGEILGYMENRMYQVIIIGEEAEIDGIRGNWLMIKPYLRPALSWVFSGYTRKATDAEIEGYGSI